MKQKTTLRSWIDTVLIPGITLPFLGLLEKLAQAEREAEQARSSTPLWSETGEYWNNESYLKWVKEDLAARRPAGWVWVPDSGSWIEVFPN